MAGPQNPDALLPFPRIVMIQTTSRCNSACIMCPWPAMAKRHPQGMMDDALYGKILEEIARHPEIELAMPYLMNEPLLDPDLPRRIDLLKDAAPQAQVYFLTNGATLTDDLAEKLLASKLDWVGFSIHALRPETYQRITGRKDGAQIIERVTRFVRRAQAAGKHPHYVMVTFTRMRPHVSDEETRQALQYWRDLGVDPVDYQDGYISRAGNVEVFGHDAIYRPRIIGCKTVWAYRIASIRYNGDVAPCCMDWNREVVWGNLRTESIQEVWTGQRRRRFLDAIHSGRPLPPGFLCTRCEDAVPAAERPEETARAAAPRIGPFPGAASGESEEAAFVADLERALGEGETPPQAIAARLDAVDARMRALRKRQAEFLDAQRRFVAGLGGPRDERS